MPVVDVVNLPTTWWTLILLIGTDTPEGRAALDELCQRYWRAVLRYLLYRGLDRASAEDVTQDFFAKLIAKPTLAKPGSRRKGSFRAYLRRALENDLRDRARAAKRMKRGEGAIHVSFDARTDPRVLDRTFDRYWAKASLQAALEKLVAVRDGDEKQLLRLRVLLGVIAGGEPDEAAVALKVKPTSIPTLVTRLKDELREAVLKVAADDVPAKQVEAEADRIFEVAAEEEPEEPE